MIRSMLRNTSVNNFWAGLYVAFSLRDILSTNQNVVRVRNTLDDSEADYTAAQVDAGLTAIGANSGFVTRLYDQVGVDAKGYLQQADTTKQVLIKNAGSMYLNNSKPYIKFDNTDRFLDSQTTSTPVLNGNNNWTIYTVFKSQGTVAPDGVFEEVNPLSVTRRMAVFSDTSTNQINTDRAQSGASNVLNNLAALSVNTVYLQTTTNEYISASVGTGEAFLDGVLQESLTWQVVFDADTIFRLGKRTAATNRFAGEFAEVLIFNEYHDTTRRLEIEANIKTYYGI